MSGKLKAFACDPSCGFEVKDHDEGELKEFVKDHAEKTHEMSISDEYIEENMREETD